MLTQYNMENIRRANALSGIDLYASDNLMKDPAWFYNVWI